MKYISILCCALSVTIFLSACSLSPRKAGQLPLSGLWHISSEEQPDYTEARERIFLNLRNDHNYTFYIPDYFDYGTWELFPEDNLLRLTSGRKQPFYGKKWDIQLNGDLYGSRIEATLNRAGALFGHGMDSILAKERITQAVPVHFTLRKSDIDFSQQDPFRLEANTWRIRPDHAESCEELKKRILNHMKHLQILFEGFSKSSSETVSYRYTPTPFEMASNGVAMLPYNSVPEAYNNIFYSREDAVTAYYLTEGFFRLHVDFPKADKYPEIWASVFRQIVQKGDTANVCGLLESRIARYRKDSALHAQQDTTNEVTAEKR